MIFQGIWISIAKKTYFFRIFRVVGPDSLSPLWVRACSLYIVAPIVSGGCVFGPYFVIQYYMSFLCCNHLDGEERAGCITFKMKLSFIKKNMIIN